MTPGLADFQTLVADHHDSVLGYLRRRAGGDAEELLVETFLVAWRRLADVPPGEPARLWLYGVARDVTQRRNDDAQATSRRIATASWVTPSGGA